MDALGIGSLKVITSTHYNRPDCTRQMLEHLSKCEGVEDYILLCGVEPGFPEVIREINNYPHRKMVFLNERLLGCWENKKSILTEGFKLGSYVIHIEDDVILAKDALNYFTWAERYREDKSIFSITAFSNYKRDRQFTNNSLVTRIEKYSPIAWATWRNRWRELVSMNWNGADVFIRDQIKRQHISPQVSRAKHIGYHHGIGSPKELLTTIRNNGHEPFAYAGLKNSNSDELIDNTNAYIKALESSLVGQTDNNTILAIKHQLEVARTNNLKRQLLINVKNEEWVKLNDHNIKTKAVSEYFQYETAYWSDDIGQVKDFHE